MLREGIHKPPKYRLGSSNQCRCQSVPRHKLALQEGAILKHNPVEFNWIKLDINKYLSIFYQH